MNIPSPPTDNLYKFLALSGVVIFIGALVLFYQQVESNKELVREIQVDVEALPRPLPFLAQTKKDFEKLMEQTNKFSIEYTRLKTKIDKANEQRKMIDIYTRYLILMLVFGPLLAIVGFVLWYEKVQKYQDAILKGQADAYGKDAKHASSMSKLRINKRVEKKGRSNYFIKVSSLLIPAP